MDLRTKLVFALVAVALGSMAALGAFTYSSARGLLEETVVDQLDGIAESRKQSVEKLASGWQERVQLIASRTQLRMSLRDYNASRSPDAAGRIRRILGDALSSTRTVESLAVFDAGGDLVAAVGDTVPGAADALEVSRDPRGDAGEYRGIVFDASSEPRLVFVAGLALDGSGLGILRATLNAEELLDVVQQYDGLGETGETMIVVRDTSGRVQLIHRQRHPADGPSGLLRLSDPDDPAVLAIGGQDAGGVAVGTDYRGHRVWAAMRFLPSLGWGLVVKRDEAELRAPIIEFRNQLTQLGITLSAFAILLGTVLGLAIARPIHALAGVANRIRAGELGARASVAREDEIGVLARTFNEMAASIESQMSELGEFHRYFDLSRDMLCIAGMDGYFKRTNPAFERVLGWTSAELLSRPFYDLIHPDDLEATEREVAKLAGGIPTIRFENRYRHADGTYRDLLWTAHPEPVSGLLYAAARDITELKQAASQLESAIRSLPAAMAGISDDDQGPSEQAGRDVRALARELEEAKARLRTGA